MIVVKIFNPQELTILEDSIPYILIEPVIGEFMLYSIGLSNNREVKLA
ncbi:hypothetical protein NBRC111894_4259 [Sporolactobacillus inulinus]|uniref:Uncharacterized protein n=1 Tax=Sporolactobacillus inulinus TaxID=2078 RepID=A0A4Y1ZHU9_9BACL|nr:hypothetical protein [Sporolactobacillus inulinus]GAY78705.1 hypothetical protein NBRC111894_4259 [Sporolactobacillus inulinus]